MTRSWLGRYSDTQRLHRWAGTGWCTWAIPMLSRAAPWCHRGCRSDWRPPGPHGETKSALRKLEPTPPPPKHRHILPWRWTGTFREDSKLPQPTRKWASAQTPRLPWAIKTLVVPNPCNFDWDKRYQEGLMDGVSKHPHIEIYNNLISIAFRYVYIILTTFICEGGVWLWLGASGPCVWKAAGSKPIVGKKKVLPLGPWAWPLTPTDPQVYIGLEKSICWKVTEGLHVGHHRFASLSNESQLDIEWRRSEVGRRDLRQIGSTWKVWEWQVQAAGKDKAFIWSSH